MNKPMYCPMAFANRKLTEPHYMNIGDQHGPYVEDVKPWMECTPDCAWAVIHEMSDGTKEYGCVVADGLNCAAAQTRPIKDDAE